MTLANPLDGDPNAAQQGKMLFAAMNCDGCHGGGAVGFVGPSLIDGRWRYGGGDGELFHSIYYGRAHGMPAYGGILLSVCSAGSAISGAIFGGIALRAPIERQFVVATGIMAVPMLLHYYVDGQVLFAVVAFLAGTCIAPSMACQSVLVSRLAPARYATEAFTWSSTCIVGGLGAGMAFGGWLIETQGFKSPFLAGAIVMAVVSLTALSPKKG